MAGAAVLGLIAGAAAEPYLPEADDVVLERLPAADDPRFAEARRLAAELRAHPDDRRLALEVARRWIDLARSEGDMRLFGLAEGALAPWLENEAAGEAPPPEVLIERSAILRARHDFAAARADLDAVLAISPGDLQALLDRAALSEAEGDYQAALADCTRFARLRPGLIAEACIASAASLAGRAGPAYRALSAALEAAPDTSAGVRRWVLTIQGEIAARRGETADAERLFETALALPGRDVYLLTVHADLLLDQGRDGDVLDLLEGEDRVDPLLLRRAIAARRAGASGSETMIRELEARFAALRLRGEATHLREEARLALHLADDPARALDLAERNWTRQRGPADARILLEAALAQGAADAGRPVLAWIDRTGIEDVALERLAARFADASS